MVRLSAKSKRMNTARPYINRVMHTFRDRRTQLASEKAIALESLEYEVHVDPGSEASITAAEFIPKGAKVGEFAMTIFEAQCLQDMPKDLSLAYIIHQFVQYQDTIPTLTLVPDGASDLAPADAFTYTLAGAAATLVRLKDILEHQSFIFPNGDRGVCAPISWFPFAPCGMPSLAIRTVICKNKTAPIGLGVGGPPGKHDLSVELLATRDICAGEALTIAPHRMLTADCKIRAKRASQLLKTELRVVRSLSSPAITDAERARRVAQAKLFAQGMFAHIGLGFAGTPLRDLYRLTITMAESGPAFLYLIRCMHKCTGRGCVHAHGPDVECPTPAHLYNG